MKSVRSILALDCSAYATSVAFMNVAGQEKQLADYRQLRHSNVILSMIDACYDRKESLDGVALGIGPGNFMSIRIALAVAQAIASVNDLPIFTMNSLKLLAWQYVLSKQVTQPITCTTAIDARRQEWYHARWHYQLTTEPLQELSPPAVVSPQDLAVPTQDVLLGDGFQESNLYGADINNNLIAVSKPQDLLHPATTLIKLCLTNFQEGAWVSANELQPLYLRNNVATAPPSTL